MHSPRGAGLRGCWGPIGILPGAGQQGESSGLWEPVVLYGEDCPGPAPSACGYRRQAQSSGVPRRRGGGCGRQGSQTQWTPVCYRQEAEPCEAPCEPSGASVSPPPPPGTGERDGDWGNRAGGHLPVCQSLPGVAVLPRALQAHPWGLKKDLGWENWSLPLPTV